MRFTVNASINKNYIKTKSKEYSISIRISHNRKNKYLRLDEKVEMKHWSGVKGAWVKSSHPLAFEINGIIQKRIIEIERFIMDLRWHDQEITLDKVVKAFQRGGQLTFNRYIRDFVSTVKGKAHNTLKNYAVLPKHLDEFNPAISFNQLNKDLFTRFATWLKNEKNLWGTSIESLFKPMRVACQQAREDGLLHRDPFDGFMLTKVIGKIQSKDQFRLDWSEVKLIRDFRLEDPEEEKIREIFLFMCMTGLYLSDIRKLPWNYIKNSEEGYVIEGAREKNGEFYSIPAYIFTHAAKIIEQQKGKHPELVFQDIISDQAFNRKIKIIVKKCGVVKEHAERTTNKTARHSFVQMLTIMQINSATRKIILGHEKESSGEHYYPHKTHVVLKAMENFDFSKLNT